MKRPWILTALLAASAFVSVQSAWAGQAPGSASDPDVPISHRDRVYAAEQFSNTVSVTDPADNKLLGVIRLGEPLPTNFSPLYKGQLLVHGMGFSPDHRTIAVVSIGSNSVTFIDTATNAVKHTTYVGRAPHEAFFTPDGKEVWVTVRGEDYVSVLDGTTYEEKTRITTPNGPGMQIFSPDGMYGYVSPWPTTRSSGRCSRQVRSARISPRRRTVPRSGSRSRTPARPRYSTQSHRSPCSRRSIPVRSPITSISIATRLVSSPMSRSAA